MNKGLEALERLQFYYTYSDIKGCNECVNETEEYSIIENRLKALEIIKNKMVNVCAFISWVNLVKFTYERYLKIQLDYLVSAKTLTEEEFDLLKEILK